MKTEKTLQFRQLDVHWTQHAKKTWQYGTDSDINAAAHMINYQGMCTKTNFQWQTTSNLSKNIL